MTVIVDVRAINLTEFVEKYLQHLYLQIIWLKNRFKYQPKEILYHKILIYFYICLVENVSREEKTTVTPGRSNKFDNLTQSVTLISQILYLIRMYLPQQVAGLVICDGEQK
jgi:hypothetical protein